jgi:large-conductance mechanosensitive channel
MTTLLITAAILFVILSFIVCYFACVRSAQISDDEKVEREAMHEITADEKWLARMEAERQRGE